ncbi:hypothetical protein [Dysgonomonas sp. ZJ279]|nr:hypothetical protein [Dysgonomonas sp. ZJ279]
MSNPHVEISFSYNSKKKRLRVFKNDRVVMEYIGEKAKLHLRKLNT